MLIFLLPLIVARDMWQAIYVAHGATDMCIVCLAGLAGLVCAIAHSKKFSIETCEWVA